MTTYLKNKSPGYWIYMIWRFVHGSELEFFVIKPTATPLSTPTHVKMVSKFRLIKPLLFTGIFIEPCFVYVVDEWEKRVCTDRETGKLDKNYTLILCVFFVSSTMTIFPNFVSECSMNKKKKKEVRNEMNKIIGWLWIRMNFIANMCDCVCAVRLLLMLANVR